MAKRDVTIYVCDGCGAQSTFSREAPVVGFKTVQIGVTPGDSGQKLLCTICYGAVEWVVKFQRITHPPRVIAANGRYGLRRRDDS